MANLSDALTPYTAETMPIVTLTPRRLQFNDFDSLALFINPDSIIIPEYNHIIDCILAIDYYRHIGWYFDRDVFCTSAGIAIIRDESYTQKLIAIEIIHHIGSRCRVVIPNDKPVDLYELLADVDHNMLWSYIIRKCQDILYLSLN